MSKWLNTKQILAPDTPHPCRQLGYCPYGQLVEEFPFSNVRKRVCMVFGHDCPVHYLIEDIVEDDGD
jgi:hypothetical protein